ncbi:MAG: TIGR03790 family protein [Patescibacteria group bacterium]
MQKINYIVTTKGVPLKVKRGDFDSDGEPASALDSERKSASVDSELALIFPQDSQYIGNPSSLGSRYFMADGHFAKNKYDMYLVTRLDGYTVADVRALIDRAKNPVLLSADKFVFDEDPTWALNLNAQMANAARSLQERGFNVVLDTTETFLANQQNVIGYASWGSNDRHATSSTEYAKPKNTWVPGAIAETYVSTSGRTFNKPALYGQSLIADLIEEGITGAKGYVYESYSSAMADVSVLFDRYTKGYNLAESFYAASPFLSWMDVVIGDPKIVLKIEK